MTLPPVAGGAAAENNTSTITIVHMLRTSCVTMYVGHPALHYSPEHALMQHARNVVLSNLDPSSPTKIHLRWRATRVFTGIELAPPTEVILHAAGHSFTLHIFALKSGLPTAAFGLGTVLEVWRITHQKKTIAMCHCESGPPPVQPK